MKRMTCVTGTVVLLMVWLTGCVSGSTPARFYTLYADETHSAEVSAAIGEEWVGVGPIDVPSYLDRPQIVTRGEGHRLIVHEFDRWADPLKDRILDVLMENVVSLSDSKRVAPYPWPSAFRPDHRVLGEINAFEAGPSGEVVLKTRWTVQIPGQADQAAVRISEYREAADAADFNSIAAAMSRALARWSRDIASAMSESMAEAQQ